MSLLNVKERAAQVLRALIRVEDKRRIYSGFRPHTTFCL